MLRGVAVIALVLCTGQASAQWLDITTPGIPRTADGSADLAAPAPRDAAGKPDLTGIWVPTSATGSLFDPEKAQGWARDAVAQNKAAFFGDDPRFHCLPSGPGSYSAGMAYGGMRRIVQHPDLLVVLNSDLTYRQIFLDGRELEEDPFPIWTGYSVGRWDGDTLVVDSNGYNDRTWLHREGLPHTEALRITERYRRTDFGSLLVDVTYEDPGTFIEPVTAAIEMSYMADTELLESVCNESSKGTSHYNGQITQAVEKVIDVDEATLRKYEGTYQGTWLGNEITAVVTVEDGELWLDRDPVYADSAYGESGKSMLLAQSENAFDCECGLGFVFTNEIDGKTNEVLEVHVSGGWTFERVQ